MNTLHVTHITTALRSIEDVVLELDRAIDVNEIHPKEFDALRNRYDHALDLLIDTMSRSNDSRYYIVDEAAGLFAWIKGEKDVAKRKISDAVVRKGDALLTSQAGRGLAHSAGTPEMSRGDDTRDSPFRGWLGFFYVTVVLVMAPALLIAVAGTVSVATLPATDQTSEAYLLLVLFYVYAGLSVFYILSTPRRSRYAPPAAILLFSLLTVGCMYLLVGPSLSGADAEVPALYYGIVFFLITCGISTVVYYSISAKVRRIFIK